MGFGILKKFHLHGIIRQARIRCTRRIYICVCVCAYLCLWQPLKWCIIYIACFFKASKDYNLGFWGQTWIKICTIYVAIFFPHEHHMAQNVFTWHKHFTLVGFASCLVAFTIIKHYLALFRLGLVVKLHEKQMCLT